MFADIRRLVGFHQILLLGDGYTSETTGEHFDGGMKGFDLVLEE
jgi:hypothetical protein